MRRLSFLHVDWGLAYLKPRFQLQQLVLSAIPKRNMNKPKKMEQVPEKPQKTSIHLPVVMTVTIIQTSKHASPDTPLPSHILKLFQGILKCFKATRNLKSNWCILGLPSGFLQVGCAKDNLTEKHPGGILIRSSNHLKSYFVLLL